MEDKFEAVFHHGGKFLNNGSLKYREKELWYCVGGGSVLENRLELLTDDRGAMHMINLARLNGQVHLFVVHLASQLEIIYLLENVCQDIGQVETENVMPDSGKGECEKEGGGQCEEEGDGECEKEGDGQCEEEDDVQCQKEGGGQCEEEGNGECEKEGGGQRAEQGDGECEKEGGGEIDVECEEQGDGDAECEQQGHGECEQQTKILGEDIVPVEEERCEGNDVVKGQIETQCEGDTATVRSWSSSGEDGNVHVNDDFMEDLVDCDIQEDLGDGNCFGDIETDVEYDGESATDISDSDVDDGINTDDNTGLSDEEWEFEELVSGAESDAEDDEESYGKFVTLTMPKSMVDYKWDLGTYFTQKEDLLDAIKTYAIQNGRNIRYVKNDKKRVRAKCMGYKGKCPWLAYCGYMDAIKTWQLRTIVDNHTCSREHKVKLLNSKWLSKRLEKTVRENPRVKGVDIVQKINRKWNVGVSQSMAYRAKAIASYHVDGSFKEQYKRIYDYANEVLTRNPGSTIQVKVEPNDDGPICRRLYVCPKACKDCFVSCRPIIGLDGAFLKGKYGGEMLIAVGKDANDQMLPIPRAATTTHPQTWEKEMTNIKELNIEAFKYLIKIPPRFKLYEVRHASQVGEKLVVDLDKHECSCRKWAISGCCHALAAMKFLNLDAEDFIPGWFRKATYEETYSSIVYPINGKNMWEITPYNDVLPPKKRALPGRPKKKRRLEECELIRDDTRMRKGGLRKRCGICRQMGHNRTSCKKSTQESVVTKQTQQSNPAVVTDQTQQNNPPNEPIMPSANLDQA
ncbi:hypothetical protein V8G54_004616 [Vigna mungo]|uniref:SWIM-type domain-containing protein n=1 Tax=Vigna mungo TaxID=3915 RepID=A0AAQ3SD44_VIGMU